MLLASKFSEIEHLSLDLIYKKVVHEKISKRVVKRDELKVLKALKFNLSKPTVYDFMTNFFSLASTLLTFKHREELLDICIRHCQTCMHDRRLSFEVRPS